MPSPREQPNPTRRRRQETMPGGWLWVVVLMLLGIVLAITFGYPSIRTIEYSDFTKLAEQKKVSKVIFNEGSNSLIAEFDPEVVKTLDENVKKQVTNNRVEVMLWDGDIKSGAVSK